MKRINLQSILKRVRKLTRKGSVADLSVPPLRFESQQSDQMLIQATAINAAAQSIIQEAVRLRSQGTKASLQQALLRFKEALSICRSLSDDVGEAIALVNLGFIHKFLGEMDKALHYYNEALLIARETGDRKSEAELLHNLGAVYKDLGDREKALSLDLQALPLRQAVNDRKGEAYTLSSIGSIYSNLGEKEKALDYLMRGLSMARSVRDRLIEGTTLDHLGKLYSSQDQKQEALKCHQQALSLFREIGDRRGQGYSLTYLGSVYGFLGQREKQLEYYQAALELSRKTGDRTGEANRLTKIGNCHAFRGEVQKAADCWQQAFALAKSLQNPEAEAAILGQVGVNYKDLGEWQRALDTFIKVIALCQQTRDRKGEATTQIDIGNTYQKLGEWQKAANCFSKALSIFRALGDLKGQVVSLTSIAWIYQEQHDALRAKDYIVKAYPISQRIGDKELEAWLLGIQGLVNSALGDELGALTCLTESLELSHKIGSPQIEAVALNNIGCVTTDTLIALHNFEKALSFCRKRKDREGEAVVLCNMASIEEKNGNLLEALSLVEQAIDILETLRINVINKTLRASYLAKRHHRYEFCVDLLMRLHLQFPHDGYDIKALQMHERGRARSLVELLSDNRSHSGETIEHALMARERSLKKQLNALAHQQTLILSQSLPDRDVIIVRIQELVSELQQLQSDIRRSNPKYAALTQPQPLSVNQMQEMLDLDSLMLVYSLGSKRSYVWVMTATSLESRELPGRTEIEEVARGLHRQLSLSNKLRSLTDREHKRDLLEAELSLDDIAEQLSRQILAPIADLLTVQRLLIVSDSVLQFIPFAVLPSPKNLTRTPVTRLVSEHEIINLPSASTLTELRKAPKSKKAERSLIIFADPVFDKTDTRMKLKKRHKHKKRSRKTFLEPWRADLTQSSADTGITKGGYFIPRLPGTRHEAEAIGSMLVSPQPRLALDFDANREAVFEPSIQDYRFIHFATHGFVNSLHPELTGIVLSLFDERGHPQDGFLRVHDIFTLKLSADLVTLSACQTGLGKDVKGEGLVGLVQGFLYSGARQVLVSLWNVSDSGTAELMIRFYRGLLEDDLKPSQALRAAQLSMINEPAFQNPYYWAPFILEGDFV